MENTKQEQTDEQTCEYCDGIPAEECSGYKCWER
jgi:hypothetical protein